MRNQLAQTSWKNKFILYFPDGTSPLYSEYGLHGSFSLLFFAFYSSDITRTLIGWKNVWISPCGGFQEQSFVFQGYKYTGKRHKWKGKAQLNAQFSFLWTKESVWLRNCLRGIERCFLHREAQNSLFEMQPRQRSFRRLFLFTLWSRKSRF